MVAVEAQITGCNSRQTLEETMPLNFVTSSLDAIMIALRRAFERRAAYCTQRTAWCFRDGTVPLAKLYQASGQLKQDFTSISCCSQ